MYSPCQLRIRPAFHTEQGKIAPHINFSVCCQQGILLQISCISLLQSSASRSQFWPSWALRTGPGLDFQEKYLPLNWNELFQLTPELSLQISVLALLSSQNRRRSWFPRTMSPTQFKWTVSAFSRPRPPVRRVRIHRVYLIEASIIHVEKVQSVSILRLCYIGFEWGRFEGLEL